MRRRVHLVRSRGYVSKRLCMVGGACLLAAFMFPAVVLFPLAVVAVILFALFWLVGG